MPNCISKEIEKLAENKISIIFISSELPEVMSISDRIIIMRSGKISGIYPGQGKTSQGLLLKVASPN